MGKLRLLIHTALWISSSTALRARGSAQVSEIFLHLSSLPRPLGRTCQTLPTARWTRLVPSITMALWSKGCHLKKNIANCSSLKVDFSAIFHPIHDLLVEALLTNLKLLLFHTALIGAIIIILYLIKLGTIGPLKPSFARAPQNKNNLTNTI